MIPAEVWFVAPDADNEETVWRQEHGSQPMAALRRCDIRSEYRDALWPMIVRSLP